MNYHWLERLISYSHTEAHLHTLQPPAVSTHDARALYRRDKYVAIIDKKSFMRFFMELNGFLTDC